METQNEAKNPFANVIESEPAEEERKSYTRRDVSIDEFVKLSFAGLSIEEQEFCVWWYRGSKTAEITTSDPTMLTKLQKIARANPDALTVDSVCYINGRECAVNVKLNRKLVSLRQTVPSGKKMTEEQRRAAAERLAKARANRFGADTLIEDDDIDEEDADE